jgi:hypothetical protein
MLFVGSEVRENKNSIHNNGITGRKPSGGAPKPSGGGGGGGGGY